MQQGYPKRALSQWAVPDYSKITYESLIRSLHKVFYGTEMPEEEVQKMLKEYQGKELKLTDSDNSKI